MNKEYAIKILLEEYINTDRAARNNEVESDYFGEGW